MIVTKINPEGNFNCWSEKRLEEIKKEKFSTDIGQAFFENEDFKLWRIVLAPKQRLPFRKHHNIYSCTCITDGLLISRNVNGAVDLLRFDKGDNYYRNCKEEAAIHDLENIGENTVTITVVEEKLKFYGALKKI